MEFKKLQRLIDKGVAVLSDHDEKRDEERYKKLQDVLEEAQDFVEKGNYSLEIEEEFKKEIKKCIDEFKESKIIFIVFLIILCGLLFIGVFYISYSHFYDHWYSGGHFNPPHHTTSKRPNKTTITGDYESTDRTTTTGSKTTQRTTTKVDSTTVTTSPSTTITTSKTTTKTTTSSSTTKITTKTTTTTKPTVIDPDPTDGFVTVIFDNSNLIDLDNIYPMLDSDGLNTTPTTWKLSSALSQGSKDYIITYTVDFVDKLDDIPVENRLNIDNLKYQLLIKKSGSVVYNSGVQEMYDYPESTDGVRPIITAQTYNNDETLDFELRMWLDSAVGNDQQGKKYRFTIDINATYEFVE